MAIAVLQSLDIDILPQGYLTFRLPQPTFRRWVSFYLRQRHGRSSLLDSLTLADIPFDLLSSHARCCTLLRQAYNSGLIELQPFPQGLSETVTSETLGIEPLGDLGGLGIGTLGQDATSLVFNILRLLDYEEWVQLTQACAPQSTPTQNQRLQPVIAISDAFQRFDASVPTQALWQPRASNPTGTAPTRPQPHNQPNLHIIFLTQQTLYRQLAILFNPTAMPDPTSVADPSVANPSVADPQNTRQITRHPSGSAAIATALQFDRL